MIWIAAVISSILYRIGGAGREEIPFANSQYRDIGVPVIVAGVLAFHFPWYIALLCGLLVLGFIRTYWDWLFGYDNMFAHGVGIGWAFSPLCWYEVAIWQIVAYTALISLTMGLLNVVCNRFRVPYAVWIEELYRGFIIIAALPVILNGWH